MVKMEDAIKCRICGSYIRMNTGYNFIPCACGTIAVDGGKEYCRIIGNSEKWEVVAIPVAEED